MKLVIPRVDFPCLPGSGVQLASPIGAHAYDELLGTCSLFEDG